MQTEGERSRNIIRTQKVRDLSMRFSWVVMLPGSMRVLSQSCFCESLGVCKSLNSRHEIFGFCPKIELCDRTLFGTLSRACTGGVFALKTGSGTQGPGFAMLPGWLWLGFDAFVESVSEWLMCSLEEKRRRHVCSSSLEHHLREPSPRDPQL